MSLRRVGSWRIRLVLACCGLAAPAAQAQVIFRFLPDSLSTRWMRQQRVRSLRIESQRMTGNEVPSPYRALGFDEQGRVTEFQSLGGHTQNETYVTRYDAKGRRSEYYTVISPSITAGDTPAPVPADQPHTLLVYDARGRQVAELTTRRGGAPPDTVKRFWQEQRGDTTWTYERTVGDRPHTAGTRKFREKDGTVRYDHLSYRYPKRQEGAPEFLDEVSSYYILFDQRHREIESGKLDYERATNQWADAHPKEIMAIARGNRLPQLILGGHLTGARQPRKRISYNAKGQVSTEWDEHTKEIATYRYDARGRVLEIEYRWQPTAQDKPGAVTSYAVFTWGPSSLPTKVTLTGATRTPHEVSTYTYKFFTRTD